MSPKDLIQRLFQITIPKPPEPIEPGLYHWMRDGDGMPTRFHLRVEPDGHGMLFANASAGARLSASGIVIAYSLLNDVPKEDISMEVKEKFTGVTSDTINRDIESVESLISTLSLPTHEFPILNFDDPALTPYESELIAPLHADVTLSEPEILLPLFDKIWQANIPHVTIILPIELDFEANHLLLAIERAEDLGMIAGMRTRASQLKDRRLVEELAVCGIDHVDVLLASSEQTIHELQGLLKYHSLSLLSDISRLRYVCSRRLGYETSASSLSLHQTRWRFQIEERLLPPVHYLK
jgi:hypothetical protein